MTWLQIAQNLPVGQKTRTNCDECGNDKNSVVVNHSFREYSSLCFACGHTNYESKGKQTLQELQRLKELNEQAEKFNSRDIKLPEDFTNDIPLVGRLWLYSGGVSPSTWLHYGVGWSESLQRVILPVYDSRGKLKWYQARATLDGQHPKYLQPAADKSDVYFESSPVGNNFTSVVVVEDILSAIRVGKHCYTVSLLGTKPSGQHVNYLSKFKSVITWMDSDRAGRKAAYNIRKSVGMLTEVSNIVTERDPKKLADIEIIKELEDVKTNI